MSEYNLHRVVLEYVKQSPHIGHHTTIAQEILDQGVIKPKDYKAALEQCLHHEVREVVRQRRSGATRQLAVLSNRAAAATRSGHDNWSIRQEIATEIGKSTYYINGVHYVLQDCTYTHLTTIIDEYWKRSEENERVAIRLSRIRELFDRHPEAEKVSDLPPEEVAEAHSFEVTVEEER